jgi:hypothetical protein
MNPRKILEKLNEEQITNLGKFLHYYFPLVSSERIKDLILQVDSIDTTLHLLWVHKESTITLDSIVYDYLHAQDNLK